MKQQRTKCHYLLTFWFLFLCVRVVFGDLPEYASNPFSFEIAEAPYGDTYWWPAWGDDFIVADVDDDTLPDYIFRSLSKLYVYKHDGSPLGGEYPISIQNVTGNGGAKFGVADVDDDGQTEIVAINGNDVDYPITIFSGSSGSFERKWPVSGLLTNQKVGHLVITNLQGLGNRDAIIQTVDINGEGLDDYYINRSLIAMDLLTGTILWRVDQNYNTSPPYYEGYWGVAHGPPLVADVDFDGKDEVVGGSFVDHDGTVNSLGYQNLESDWVDRTSAYIDHLDAISVGDFDVSRNGLEWVVTEEDHNGRETYNTILFSFEGLSPVWKRRPESLMGSSDFAVTKDYEAQNLVVGDFDAIRAGKEIWNRSRMGGYTNPDTSQHPWIYDISGNLIADYRMDDVLPANPAFSALDNNEGVEMIWSIDWDGSAQDYIACKARHENGEVGVFNAMTMNPVWFTSNEFASVEAHLIYVADVAGDEREEVCVCDVSVTPPQIRVYWNENTNSNPPVQRKWDDPLYRRLKQNWNYYSPGSYSQPAPVCLQLNVLLEGAWDTSTHQMNLYLWENGHIPLESPYSEDPRTVEAIPDSVVDWILVELRPNKDSDAVIARSFFLHRNGRVVAPNGSDTLSLSVFRNFYFVVVRHRNHLPVMSADSLKFSADSTTVLDFMVSKAVYYKSHAQTLEPGIFGMVAADANGDAQILMNDKNDVWWVEFGRSGYHPSDFNLDGNVMMNDKNDLWWPNFGLGSQVP